VRSNVALQLICDRLACLPVVVSRPADFPPPLDLLWAAIQGLADLAATQQTFAGWVGKDANRKALAAEIGKLIPGSPSELWKDGEMSNAYQPLSPLIYLVEGALACDEAHMLYGAPGCFKSLLALDMLLCVAAGIPWLPPLDASKGQPIPVVQAPTMWVDFDNGKRRTHERIAALGRGHGVPIDAPFHFYSMPIPRLNLSDMKSVDALCDRIDRFKIKAVGIDNLGLVSGGVDENKSEMIPVMEGLRYIVEETHATTVMIHHQNKGNGMVRRAGERIRGHSSIESALDQAMIVEREAFSDNISILPAKCRGAPVLPFDALFEYSHKPGTKDLMTARFLSTAVQRDPTIETVCIDVITQKQPVSQSVVVAECKRFLPNAGRNTILAALKSLETVGVITTKRGNSRNTVLYLIA